MARHIKTINVNTKREEENKNGLNVLFSQKIIFYRSTAAMCPICRAKEGKECL